MIRKFKIEIEDGPWFVVYRQEYKWIYVPYWDRMCSFKEHSEALQFINKAKQFPEYY